MLTRQGRVFVNSDLPYKGAINLKELGIVFVLLSEAGVPGFIEEEHLRRHVQVVTGYAQTKGFGGFCRAKLVGPGANGSTGHPGAYSCLLLESRDHRRDDLDSHVGLLLWATTRLRAEHRQAQQESAWAKAAEAALLQSQERNRAIVDTALDGVITIDSTGIVTDWNAQATAIFGWSREDSAGTSPFRDHHS